MKNIIFILFSLIFSRSILATGQVDTANSIADALASQFAAVNSLSEENLCLFYTVWNSEMSIEDKAEALLGNESIQGIFVVMQATIQTLENFNALAFIERSSQNKTMVALRLEWDINGHRPNSGCSAWAAANGVCNSDYVTCATFGYIGPLYYLCATAVVLACTNSYISCGALADAQYPGCNHTSATGSGGGPLYKNPIIMEWNGGTVCD